MLSRCGHHSRAHGGTTVKTNASTTKDGGIYIESNCGGEISQVASHFIHVFDRIRKL